MLLPAGHVKGLQLDDELRFVKAMAIAMSSSVSSVSRLGARNIVLTKFVDAVLPLLTSEQCARIAPEFQRSIGDVMALMDDRRLPAEYHKVLLEETNACLQTLKELR